MWSQLIIIVNVLIINNIQGLEVGDECKPNNENKEGVCTIITECEVAIKAIRKKNYHSFLRCGFEDLSEVVCCPRQTATKFGPDRGKEKTERKADRECKKIMDSSTPPLDLHIIGGEYASLGEFPHMVAIGYFIDNAYQFNCGGALVSTTYVLTAAHCIINLERIEPQMVRAGVVDIGDDKWHDETDYRVVETITHPNYTHSSKYNDIALLRLDRPVEVSSNLNAACLFTSGDNPKGPLTITGWGKISTTQNLRSNILLKTNVTAVSRARCGPHYAEWRKLPRGITDDQICAGDPDGGRDACQGDSGGPLQVTVGSELQYRLVGVTSFGRGCGTPTPGVYTRVANYIDWIETHVWPD